MDDDRRQQHTRRATDVELATLTEAFRDLVSDVGEIKGLLQADVTPRLRDLEDWRISLAAVELEREKNRVHQERNVINKRQFWFGLAGLAFTMIATATGLAALVISHS